MPTLAIGRFTCAAANPDDTLSTAVPVTFFYAPLHLVLWGSVLGLFGFAFVHLHGAESFSAAKYVVLVPGLIGVVFAVFNNTFVLFLGIPLACLTVLFLTWRLLRVQNSLWAAFQAFILCIVMTGLYLALSEDVWRSWEIYPVYSLILGGCTAWPLVALRLAVRRRASWKRLLVGLVFGPAVPILVLFGSGIFDGAPWWAYLLTAGFFGVPPLLYTGLIRWNRWAREVATGAMFRPVVEDPEGGTPPGAVPAPAGAE